MKNIKPSVITIFTFLIIASACQKENHSSIKFYNTSEFQMEDVVVNGKNIGIIESGKASGYIEYDDFQYYYSRPYVSAEISLEGERIENNLLFNWICETNGNPISIVEGKKQIEIKVTRDSLGQKYFYLKSFSDF